MAEDTREPSTYGCRQRKDGRWEARVMLIDGRRLSAYGMTAGEARRRLHAKVVGRAVRGPHRGPEYIVADSGCWLWSGTPRRL